MKNKAYKIINGYVVVKFLVPNCPQHELQDQIIKVSQDFSVGISQRPSEFTPSQRQSFHSPAQARLARLNMTFPK